MVLVRPPPGRVNCPDSASHFGPSYKYNDFSVLNFGQRLRVDMRYWPDPAADAELSKPATQAHGWVPMVCGPVTDMRFDFTTESGARVTVSGEDDLSQLKDRLPTRKEFQKASEMQIARQVLKLAKYPLTSIADSDSQVQRAPLCR